MANPRVLILRTAGTNCDQETKHAFELAGAETGLVHVNRLINSAATLDNYQIIVIPGGFTYGDDVAAGKLLAIELMKNLGKNLQEFVDKGGVIMGICNGFQVLVKTGLLPEAQILFAADREITLTHNDSRKFEARWIRLAAPHNSISIFAEPGEEIELPVAHGEGKLVARSAEVVKQLVSNGQVVYRYVNAEGGAPTYPEDPNGSVDNIAGICDVTGRVFGLMPHPERYVYPYQHPRWTREYREGMGAGLNIFKRAVNYFKKA